MLSLPSARRSSTVSKRSRTPSPSPRALTAASMVVTGEGRFDEGSLEGKVTGGLAAMIDGRVPLLILCGSVEPHAREQLLARFDNLRFLDLERTRGRARRDQQRLRVDLATLLEELRGTRNVASKEKAMKLNKDVLAELRVEPGKHAHLDERSTSRQSPTG